MNGSSSSPAYRTFTPGAYLRDSVEVIWVQDCAPVPNAEPTTIVPTGRVELIFHYGDPYAQLHGTDEQLTPTCHVVGQQKRPLVVNATGRTGIVIVRFRPWGAHTLFGEMLPEIQNQLVDLELIWGRACLDGLVDQLYHAGSAEERARIVESFVSSRLIRVEVDRLSVESVNSINLSWGRNTVDGIARQFDLGRRQFNRRFTRAIGASPKQLSGVLRAQKAITCIRAGVNVQDIVLRCGYADQSHLIRDVVNHSNRRPTDLAKLAASNAHRFFTSTDLSAFCGVTYL